MALVCPACGTENRAVAKFCIECIGPLDTEFEPTQLVARRDSSSCTTLMGMPTALAEFASSASPSSAPAATWPGKARAAEPRKGLWLSVAAFAIVLAVGAGGWMIAGAGGLYLYSAAAVEAAPAPPPALAPAAATVAPMPLPSPALAPLPVVSFVAPVEAPALVAVAPAPLPAAPRVAVAARSVPAPLSPPPAAARVTVPTDPGAACADLGFIARTRCVATQCGKTEHRGHSSCQAVFAQQRLMEEKRNPTLAN